MSIIKAVSGLIFAAMLMIATPNIALAAAPTEADASGYINEIINKPYTPGDLAHRSLAQLFGGFIFEPFGNAPAEYPPTALSGVLGYSNIVALILGVVIMVYVILAGALNTAASGEMLGKSWSSVWLPLRTAMAFALVMPASSSTEQTFSVAQSLVIYLIIIGSNSATWLWEKGVDLLISGSPIMATSLMYEANDFEPYPRVLHCSAALDKILTDKNNTEPNIVRLTQINKAVVGHVHGQPILENDSKITYKQFVADIPTHVKNSNKISFDNCGSISIPQAADALDSTTEENTKARFWDNGQKWEQKMQAQFDASIYANLPALLKSAADYANFMVANDINQKKISEGINTNDGDVEKLVLDAAMMLGKTDAAYDTFVTNVSSSLITEDIADQWYSMATEGGWMKAGAWFFQASRLQGYVQTLTQGLTGLSDFKPSKISFVCFWSDACKERNSKFYEDLSGHSTVATKLRELPSSNYALNNGDKSQAKIALTSSQNNEVTFSKDTTETISTYIAQVIMNSILWMGEDNAIGTGGSTGGTSVTSATGMASPFTVVSGLGRGLQQISVTIWAAGLIVAGASGLESSFWGQVGGAATGGATAVLAGMAKYVMATMVPVMAGISGLAFMLAFAIPFMPVTVWIMLVCGYLVTTIEAIAAAPLAVIMLATPEGDGISGHNFQKALQMINAIILRPTLSIIGLFAAMTLAYVGFSILNQLFWSVAGTVTNFSIFEVLAILFIYSSLAFKFCEYMVSVIHKIPDQIMEWMGGGMSRPFGEDAAGQDVTGTLQRNAAAGGMAVGAGAGSVGKSIAARREAAAARAEEAKAQGGGGEGR